MGIRILKLPRCFGLEENMATACTDSLLEEVISIRSFPSIFTI